MDKRDLDTIGSRLTVIGRQLVDNLRLALAKTDKADEALLATLAAPPSAEAMILAVRHFVRRMPSAKESLEVAVFILEIRAQLSIWNDSGEDFVAVRRLLVPESSPADWMYDFMDLYSALRDEHADKLQEAEAQYRALALKTGYAAHVALTRLGLLALRGGKPDEALQMLSAAAEVEPDEPLLLRGHTRELYDRLIAEGIRDESLSQYSKLLGPL